MCTVKFTVSTNPGGKPGKLYKQVRGTRYINDSLAAKYGNKNTQATSRIFTWKQKKEKSVSFIQLPFSSYTNKLQKQKAKHSLFNGHVKDVFRHFPKRINK